jgi:Fe-S-cluster-containing hydrogenase component 2
MFMSVDALKCTGCRLCELSCSFAKEGSFRPSISRISILRWSRDALSVPVMCLQCDERYCVKECPRDAIALVSMGDVSVPAVNQERCRNAREGGNCTICSDSCPYKGVVLPQAKKGRGVPLICDLCGGTPACVEACYPAALSLTEARDLPRVMGSGDEYVSSLRSEILRKRDSNVEEGEDKRATGGPADNNT